MKARITAGMALALLVLLFLTVRPSSGQTGFIIENADATVYAGMAGSPQFTTLLSNVAPRFIVWGANGLTYRAMVPIPAALHDLLAQVGDRIILRYANASVTRTLAYPAGLAGDQAPPVVGVPSIEAAGTGIMRITWTTDEFAVCSIAYGTSPSGETQTGADPLFYKLHVTTLPGLTAGATYYYRISCADRSANAMQTPERSFVASSLVYLPMTR